MCVVQTLEMLEKKEQVLTKKAAAEVEKAKEFTRAKNKRGMFDILVVAYITIYIDLLLIEHAMLSNFHYLFVLD